MYSFEYNIEKDNGQVIPLEVNYKVYGEHLPATRHEPEEFPEVEIDSIRHVETGDKVELTEAEWQEMSCKAEEHHAKEREDAEDGRADYLYEMRDCQAGGW